MKATWPPSTPSWVSPASLWPCRPLAGGQQELVWDIAQWSLNCQAPCTLFYPCWPKFYKLVCTFPFSSGSLPLKFVIDVHKLIFCTRMHFLSDPLSLTALLFLLILTKDAGTAASCPVEPEKGPGLRRDRRSKTYLSLGLQWVYLLVAVTRRCG